MSYALEFSKSAAGELRKLPKDIQKRIIKVLDMLRIDPFSEILKIRKLRGYENLFRIRVGDYRVVYAIENNQMIFISRIRHRKEVYENL